MEKIGKERKGRQRIQINYTVQIDYTVLTIDYI